MLSCLQVLALHLLEWRLCGSSNHVSQGWCEHSGAEGPQGTWFPLSSGCHVCIGISSLREEGGAECLKCNGELCCRGLRSAEGPRHQVMQWWPHRGTSLARPHAFSHLSGGTPRPQSLSWTTFPLPGLEEKPGNTFQVRVGVGRQE